MKVFIPIDIFNLYYSLLIIILVLVLGYFIGKLKLSKLSIPLAWLLVLVSMLLVERISAGESPGFRMLAVIITTLFSMKAVVTAETYKGVGSKLSFIQWLAFSAGWFGMRPQLFECFGKPALSGARPLIVFGISRIFMGLILLFTINWIGIVSQPVYMKYILTACALTGISLILHFGLLNVSAGMWRLSGVNTTTLFRSPLSSTSLTEFWGRRWNLAFSEMTAIAIYRPLKGVAGVTLATVMAFLFSGLLHEMAISVPVMTGLGLPLIYFLIHGSLMLFENFLDRRGMSISKNKIVGRSWVIFWLAAPMPILFHETFIKKIVWPLVFLRLDTILTFY